MYVNPSISDFKSYFSRDFPFGTDPTQFITDLDITNAMMTAAAMINCGLFTSQENYTIGFLNLSAHSLVLIIKTSSQGISSQFSWPASSKAVGSVSETISIPQRILDNPLYSYYTKTGYGAIYLMMILPMLSGVVYTVHGTTQP